jgi:hypothetical protein
MTYEFEMTEFQSQFRVPVTDAQLSGSGRWDREHGLREYLLCCIRLEGPMQDDLLIRSDLDQIA